MVGGLSRPFGNYGSKDATLLDGQWGLATNGTVVSIIFDENRKRKVVNPFLQYTYNSNKMDETAAGDIALLFDPHFKKFQAVRPWRQQILFVGARVNYFGNGYELFVKPGIGIGWLNTYAYNLYYDSLVLSYGKFYGKDAVLKNKGLSAYSLVYSIGVGTNINISSGISLCFGYEIYYSRPDYNAEKLFDINNIEYTNTNTSSVHFKIPFETAAFYAGLKFLFVAPLQKKIKNIFANACLFQINC